MSTPSDDFLYSTRFASLVEGLMLEHHVPGLAAAIVHDQHVTSAAYGKGCLADATPCTTETLFDIGSCAKSFTAAAVGMLVNDNDAHLEVQWDATMSSLLPDDFVMSGVGYTEGVTVEDILGHRSGMAAHNDSYMSHRASRPDDARSITRNLRNLPVAAPIRARYLYCNMMYTVASYLVEVKSKQTFGDFLRDRIFLPLDMQSTDLQPKRVRSKGHGNRLATGHYWDKTESTYHAIQSSDCEEGQGAGSIITSIEDFIKWVKAFINHEGPINEKLYQGLVRGRTLKNPYARRLKPHSTPAVYAAGLEVHYYRGSMVVGHDGTVPGFTSRFFFMPDLKFGAAILTNSSDAGPLTSILARELMDQVLQVPEIERPFRRFKKTTHGSHSATKESNIESSVGRSLDQHSGAPKHSNASKSQRHGENGKDKLQQNPGHCDRSGSDQKTPLAAYTGKYSHPGYRTMIIQIKDNALFIDATDRSMGFTLTFEHLSDQTKYTAHLSDMVEGGDDAVEAEFIFDHDVVVMLGLHLEPALKELIWFKKVTDGEESWESSV